MDGTTVSLRLAEGILSMCVPTTMTGELGARPYMVWKVERGGVQGEWEGREGGRWRGGARRRGQGERGRRGGGKSRGRLKGRRVSYLLWFAQSYTNGLD